MATMAGTVELLIGSGETMTSEGLPGVALTVDLVPAIVGALKGYTGIAEAAPVERAGRLPVAEWTAQTPDGRDAVVVLWEEVPFEETAHGKALAAANAPDEPAP